MVDTLEFGRKRGWKQIVFGHIGRKPEGSLAKVAKRLGELLKMRRAADRRLARRSTTTILPAVSKQIADAKPGAVLMLENTRKYEIETVLWKAKPADLPTLAPKLAKLANEFAEKLEQVLRVRSVLGRQPRCVQRRGAGGDGAGRARRVRRREFTGPMMRCLDAQLVVFSGLKVDKLDDLEAMIDRGKITRVFAAGSLAMALAQGGRRARRQGLLPRRGRRPGPQGQAVLHSAGADRAGQANDRRRPQEGHQVRPAGRLRD